MAIIVNSTNTEKLNQFRILIRTVAKTHPGMMPYEARQVLLNEAKALGIDPIDIRKVLKMYLFSPLTTENQWISVTEETYPRWKILPGYPELGTCWREPYTGMEFVWIHGGEFEMGNLFGHGFGSEKPVHVVELDGFWLGRYPVIQEEWVKRMEGNPPNFKVGDRHPVENISWLDAQAFIQAMNTEGDARFRLPTEAEWEYAARSGGKLEKFAGGNEVDCVAWYHENSNGSTHPVGKKAPNGLGLYDMSGNVLEWCQDWFHDEYYKKSPHLNPKGPPEGSYRVLRSGSWDSSADYVRSSGRNYWEPDNRDFHSGFRIVRTFL